MARYDNLLHKTHAQRYPSLYLLYNQKINDPDTVLAFSEINAIAKLAIENGDDDLLLETKAMKVNYYHYHNVYSHYPSELVRAKINELLAEANQKGKKWLEADMESALASHFYVSGQYENSFEHAHRMYVIFSKQSFEEFPEKKNYLCEFANRLYLFRDYRLAIQYLTEASKDSLHEPWDAYFIQCPNTMGLCYRALNMFDSSSYYFSLAKQRAIMTGSRQWEGICDGNLGENYFLQSDYERAKPLLQHDADISSESQDWGLAANALSILGEISLGEKDVKTAEQQLMKAWTYARWSKQEKRLAKVYPLLSKFFIATGDRAKAAAFLDSALIARDSVDREFNTLYRIRAVQKVELEKERFAIAELNNQQQIKTLQRNTLVAIILLGSAVVFFIYDKQKQLYRKKNAQLKRTAEELEQAARELDNFTKSVSEKNNLIETLQQQVGSPNQEVLRQLQESTILTEEQWMDFKRMFDKVHAGYLQRLQEKLPSLTPAETRFVVLSRLKLSSREMASMLGVGPDAIRKYRSRLRKKLELPEEESIDELVSGI